MPHGPALCVRRLGSLRGHRSLSCDLTSPHDNSVYAASIWLLRRKLLIQLCAADSRETRKLPILSTKMVGGPDLNPGPHGPESHDISSNNAVSNRFQFEISTFGPA